MIIKYLLTLTIFLGIDFVWLKYIARDLYFTKLGHLLAEKPNMIAAGIFYFLYPFGLVLLGLNNGLREGTPVAAFLYGAMFGFFTYATYDLTNQATLKNWPVSVTVIDIIWGTLLSGTVSLLAFLILNR